MRLSGGQHRFVLGTLGGWAGLRVVLMWSAGAATLSPLGGGIVHGPASRELGVASGPRAAWSEPIGHSAPPMSWPAVRSGPPPGDPFETPPTSTFALPAVAPAVSPPFAGPPRLQERHAPGLFAQLPAPAGSRSRWVAEAYLFVRPGSGRPSLAAGGTLGGSQAAARLAYQLNPTGPVSTAVAARLYAPLASKGAQAALGLDWHPLANVPLRLSVERRFDLDGKGRAAWSAYAAGGFYREERGGRLIVEGYGQAGLVGLERHDLFVDSAIRAGRRMAMGPGTATLGAGLWGAAQPDVSRLDVGPRAAISLPVAKETVSVALEGRMRIAGHARPGSGATLTIAFDL